MIILVITACLAGNVNCGDIRAQTLFQNVKQCNAMSLQALPQVMAMYPKRHAVRWKCMEEKTARDA